MVRDKKSKINGDTGFYTVTDDAFVQTGRVNYDTKADIVNITNGKITAYKTRRELYNFLNELKKKRIDGYKMPNMINTVSDGEKSGMMTVITACADVMEFDIRNYDYDTVMKYILCTNQNFKILTDIPFTKLNGTTANKISVVILFMDEFNLFAI